MRASSSDTAAVCPHSLVAPALLTRRIASKDATTYGHLVHYWKEVGPDTSNVLPYGKDWSVQDVELLERKLMTIGFTAADHAALWPLGGIHERTFALDLTADPPTMRWYDDEHPQCTADEWKASFPTEFLTGTLDYVGIKDGLPWVDDLKTGRWPVDPAKSRQLRSYALAVWVGMGCPGDFRCKVSITQWPKYPLDGRPWRTYHVLDAMDLEEHLEDLRYAVTHPDVAIPGDWCTFCDAREPIPGYSEWAEHYLYRAYPSCAKGLAFDAKPVVHY